MAEIVPFRPQFGELRQLHVLCVQRTTVTGAGAGLLGRLGEGTFRVEIVGLEEFVLRGSLLGLGLQLVS